MSRYIIKRLLLLIPIVIGVAILIFTIMYFCPGDPAEIVAGTNATQVQIEAKRIEMGLDRPYIVRLLEYLRNVFIRFDFGVSYINGKSVTSDIIERFPYTLIVAALSVLLMIIVGIPLGIMAAVNHNTWKDNASMFAALIGTSIPNFWLAMLLSVVFCVWWKILPATGVSSWKCFILPLAANSLYGIAMMARQARSSMLEVIRSDYVVTARAKGQTERKVIWKHALGNALIPLVTIAGSHFGMSLGGTLIIETIFSIPGLGLYLLTAINNRDYPCVQGPIIFISILFGLVMLGVDIIYAAIDPRIKAEFINQAKKKKKIRKGGAAA